MRQKFLVLESALKASFLEREEEARGLSLAALSGQHIFFLGAPGTAKTAMVRWYADKLQGARYFYWLLTRFSTPEELFGPVDLAAMKTGTYKRVTAGKFPEAEVAFLDELMKANSAILNANLSILQERIFHNNGAPQAVPLIFAAGASNELPEEDEALEALYDRFLLRFHVSYLRERDSFKRLLALQAQAKLPAPVISRQELADAQNEVKAMPVSVQLVEGLADLRDQLRHEGITVSDRRFVQSLTVLKAQAWLEGQAEAGPECIETGAHIFWTRPDEARKVRGLCLQVSNPSLFRAQQIIEAAEEAAARILDGKGGNDVSAQAIQVSSQLKKLAMDLDSLSGGKPGRIADQALRVRMLNREVIRKGVGLEV